MVATCMDDRRVENSRSAMRFSASERCRAVDGLRLHQAAIVLAALCRLRSLNCNPFRPIRTALAPHQITITFTTAPQRSAAQHTHTLNAAQGRQGVDPSSSSPFHSSPSTSSSSLRILPSCLSLSLSLSCGPCKHSQSIPSPPTQPNCSLSLHPPSICAFASLCINRRISAVDAISSRQPCPASEAKLAPIHSSSARAILSNLLVLPSPAVPARTTLASASTVRFLAPACARFVPNHFPREARDPSAQSFFLVSR